ncbi:MAG: hypothetical protein Q7V57_05530 [Actinomycetota bacterium]|nr:hypothetical protein [Actinomycetota bacterium]
MNRHRTLGGLAALVLVAVVGCSSTTSNSGGTPDTSAPDTSVPDTATGDTSVSSTTSTSTTIPPVDALLLRSDGVGAHDFGDDVTDVYDDFETLLGFPESDLTDEYPVPSAIAGMYDSVDGEYEFIAPFSRTVCWANTLCMVFGGSSAGALSFTGWRYTDDAAATLSSESGASLGTSWSALPGMTVSEGGCYTVGYGEVDGIQVVLLSIGLQFTEVDSSGNYINNTPDPADVTIMSMETGDLPLSLYGDC